MQCSTKRSPHPPIIRISVGGIYFCDITNTGKQLCSPNEPFVVVLEKGFFKNEISPFGVDFEICNFVDLFMPKHTHYTLTKIQKVKKHNRTPLNGLNKFICIYVVCGWCRTIKCLSNHIPRSEHFARLSCLSMYVQGLHTSVHHVCTDMIRHQCGPLRYSE